MKRRDHETWHGVPGTDIEVNEDGTQFRWTFDMDGAEFLATELSGDGTGRDMWKAIRASEERGRIHRDSERYGFTIVMVPR